MKSKFKNILLLFCILLVATLFAGCDFLGTSGGGTIGGVYDLKNAEYKIKNADELIYDGEDKHPVIEFYKSGKLHSTLDTADYCRYCGGTQEQNGLTVLVDGNHHDVGEHRIDLRTYSSCALYTGYATISYTILPADAQASTFDQLKTLVEQGHDEITLTADITIPQGEWLEVSKKIFFNGHTVTNYGVFDVYGNGQLVLGNDAKIVNYNDLSLRATNSIAKNFGNSYIVTDVELEYTSNIPDDFPLYRRYDVAEIATLEYVEHDYAEQQLTPQISFSQGIVIPQTEYQATYQNNKNVGTATVTVTAKENSFYLYGQKSFQFVINRVTPTVTTQEQADTVFADQNYTQVNLFGSFSNVTIPSWATVSCYGNGCAFETLVNNGKLIIVERDHSNVIQMGSFTNNGNFEIAQSKYLQSLVVDTFTNNGQTVFAIDSQIDVSSLIDGNGNLASYGNVFLGDNAVINATFANYGNIVYDDVDAFATTTQSSVTSLEDGKLIERINIATSGVTATEKVNYSTTPALPTVNWSKTVYASDYQKTYHDRFVQSDGSNYIPTNTRSQGVDVGTYAVKYLFDKYSLSYYGEITFPYTIVRAGTLTVRRYHADNPYLYALGKKISATDIPNLAKNYLTLQLKYTVDTMLIDVDINDEELSVEILENCSVTLNGKVKNVTNLGNLTVDNTLTCQILQNNASLYLDSGATVAVDSLQNESSVSLYGAKLTANSIINNGSFFNHYNSYSDSYATTSNQNIIAEVFATGQNSVIYFNDQSGVYKQDGTSLSVSDGTIYVRQPASSVAVTVNGHLDYTSGIAIYHIEQSLEAITTCKLGQTYLLFDTDYTIGCLTTNSGENLSATLSAKSSSKYIYGEASFKYTCQTAEISVATIDELYSAVASKNEQGLGNYHKITVTSNIVASTEGNRFPTDKKLYNLVIAENTTLEFGSHIIMFEIGTLEGTVNVHITNNGTLKSDGLISVDVYYKLTNNGIYLKNGVEQPQGEYVAGQLQSN